MAHRQSAFTAKTPADWFVVCCYTCQDSSVSYILEIALLAAGAKRACLRRLPTWMLGPPPCHIEALPPRIKYAAAQHVGDEVGSGEGINASKAKNAEEHSRLEDTAT